VIEHASDAPSLVKAACALLRPNGLLFVSTINRTWKAHLLTIVGAEYAMRYIPIGTHDWNKYLSPREVEDLLLAENQRMHQLDVSGMVLTKPPLWGNWNWKLDSNDLDVNWIGTYRKGAAA
jgi:2-polyprenyl-6-hydroxyphenyl methylase/3-demethylubiquinone-9 3-methyltransferase